MMEEVERNAAAVRGRCHKFSEFVKAAWPVIEPGTKLRWNWHLDAICDHLQAITESRLKPRLIINVPPGSSKSTIVAVLWQAWEWGPRGLRHHRFVSTSFELENVKRDTRKTRDLIMSEWYQALWPEVAMKRAGETSFANSDTGSREGVAFASVTGKRGDRLVVDDPHSLKGAESDVQRVNTTRLFIEGGLNRTNDPITSAIVVVMQRLHQDDLTGALLAQQFGFVHLFIPMEFEPARRCETPLQVDDPMVPGGKAKKNWSDPRSYEGELMDPGRVPESAVETLKLAGEYMWNGQYQQRPAPREGGLFKVDQISIVDSAPAGGKPVSAWDIAASKKRTSPFTVRVRMKRVRGVVYIDDVRRERKFPNEVEEMIEKAAADDGHGVLQALPQDPGQAGKAQKMRFAELLAGYDFRITPETGSKEDRARPFAAQVGAGNVRLVRGAWNAAYIDELRNFPAGSYKDQVDASSRGFQEILSLDRPGDDVSTAGPVILEPADFAYG